MIRVTIIESNEHVLYTVNTDYELDNVSRICSFVTSPFAIKELQERKGRVVHAGGLSRAIKPCKPDEWFSHETYENMVKMLKGHSLPIEGQFLSAQMVKKDGAKIPLQFVHDAYCLFCEKRMHSAVPIKTLGKVFRDHYGVVMKQTTHSKRNVTCIIGYELL